MICRLVVNQFPCQNMDTIAMGLLHRIQLDFSRFFIRIDEVGLRGAQFYEKNFPAIAFSLPFDAGSIALERHAESVIGGTLIKYDGVMRTLAPIRKCHFTGWAGRGKYLHIFFASKR